jgi:fructuronate reductase
MTSRILDQELLEDKAFWKGKKAQLPAYDRRRIPVKSLSFSAGRMAYGHTGDILQDLLDKNPEAGMMAGIETFAMRYVTELAASDYMMTQLIFGSGKGEVLPKIQGALKSVLMVDGNAASLSFQKMLEYARDPRVEFATINAPEGAYGVAFHGGEFAEAVNPNLKKDLDEGTVATDPAKWAAFALERFKAGLKFALVSCTNFSGNGHVTGATLRMVAQAWEKKGFAPKGFTHYLSDPAQFSFPNTMIDRIAVAPDDASLAVMAELGVRSNLVVTEKVRYWAVEDLFPAGRPALQDAEGVFMCPDYEDVKRYEDMKLRILNMSHSAIAGLGVLLGYRGKYAIYKAMQDKELTEVITRIIDVVIRTVARPKMFDPKDFARDAILRLNNPNIPDDPMRIALNGSTKMKPRFMDTYFAARDKGMSPKEMDLLLLPVAGFLRYLLAVDDAGQPYALEEDPMKAALVECGGKARLGDGASAVAFKPLIASKEIMGEDLYASGEVGKKMESLVGEMLKGPGAVRATIQKGLKG